MRRRRVTTSLALVALVAWTPGSGSAETEGEAAAPAPGRAVHEVSGGETLSRIAEDRLGDASLWVALYRANRDQIQDPARIYPGQKLAIPVVEAAERAALRREAVALTPR